MPWAKNGTADILTVAGTNMNIPDLNSRTNNLILTHGIGVADVTARTTINQDSASLYANNRRTNGLANQTVGSQADWYYGTNINSESTYFTIAFILAVPLKEKFIISWYVNIRVAGAATPPEKVAFTGKYVPSPDATITRIDENSSLGNYDVDSTQFALGTS